MGNINRLSDQPKDFSNMLKTGEPRQAAPSFNINDEIEKHISKG